jgi:hypothetical protein
MVVFFDYEVVEGKNPNGRRKGGDGCWVVWFGEEAHVPFQITLPFFHFINYELHAWN